MQPSPHPNAEPGEGLSHEERLRILDAFTSATTDTVTITDADLTTPEGPLLLSVNPAGLRYIEGEARDIVGKRLNFLYVPEILDRIRTLMHEAVETRRPVIHEFFSQPMKGKSRWMQVYAVPVSDSSGEVKYFLRIARDVTAHKRAEAEREHSQRLLASVFGLIDQAVSVIDEAGNCALANAAFSRLLGRSVPDLMGRPWIEMVAESDQLRIAGPLFSHIDAKPCRLDARLQPKHGAPIPGVITAAILLQPDNRLYRVLTFTPDGDTPSRPAVAMQASEGAAAPPADPPFRANTRTVLREPVFDTTGRRASFSLLRLPGGLQRRLELSRGVVIADDGTPVDTDCLMLNLAAEQAAKDEGQGIRSSFGIPVDYGLFDAKPRLEAFLKLCDGLNPAQRSRLIVILQHVPAHTQRDRIADIVQILRPYTRHVGFEHVELGGSSMTHARHNATLVTLAAERIGANGHGPSGPLEKLVSQVHLEGAKVLVHHVPAGTPGALWHEAGVDLICG
jgi:PAS domain S-box-containing protein